VCCVEGFYMLCKGFYKDKSWTIVTTYFVDSLEDCVKLRKIFVLCATFPLIV